MRRRLAVAVAATLLLVTGCAGPTDAAAPAPDGSGRLQGELTVSAAASLRTVLDRMAAAFAEENPGVTVQPFVYDGSSTLATQILEGATPDVFAAADEATMARITDAGLAEDPALFASNRLVIAVPPGNPGGVTGLASLGDAALTVVLCAPEVPCGAASATLLGNAGVTVSPASLEQNVAAVLTKVRTGEADAGLVYVTDVLGQTDVDPVEPEGAAAVVNRYPIAAITDAPHPAVAAAFVAFVRGATGQRLLADAGFGAP